MRRREPARAQVAIEATGDQVREAAAAALARNERDLCALLDAALDYAGRIRRLVMTLNSAIERGHIEQAARTAGALSALARLAESRVLCAVERRRAALEVVDETLAGLPGGRTEWLLRKNERQTRYRARKGRP